MQKRILNVFILLGVLIFALPIYSQEEANGYNLTLPINHISAEKVTLIVKISSNYKPLEKLPAKFMEFIPKAEDPKNWSEIITLQFLPNAQVSAPVFIAKVKSLMTKEAEPFKTLDEGTKDMGSYTVSWFGAVYQGNNRREVVFIRYYSGPADLVGIQYAKPLGPKDTPEAVLKDLKSFVDSISQVAMLGDASKTNSALKD